MGALAILPTDAAVEAAWQRYRVYAAALTDNPALAADRGHMEAMTRAEQQWKRAFLAQEGRR